MGADYTRKSAKILQTQEIEHFCRWRQKEVAKIVHCGLQEAGCHSVDRLPYSGGGGPPGEPGEGGTRGDDGQPGASDGSVNPTYTGNCGEWTGGGGTPDLEPGGGGSPSGYCTPWYWVWYHCEDYAAQVNIKDERNKSAHHATGSPEPIAAFVWECFEVDRWYAGCW